MVNRNNGLRLRCKLKRPRGYVEIVVRFKFRDGDGVMHVLGGNLFVNAGLPALAALLGGDTAGQFAAAIGFGSSARAPTVNDTTLTAAAYYKALDSHSENGSSPGPGTVQFNWSLTVADTGAFGITIQELGLFANPTAVALPGATTPTVLLARKTISPITFTSGMNLTGSWTLTF